MTVFKTLNINFELFLWVFPVAIFTLILSEINLLIGFSIVLFIILLLIHKDDFLIFFVVVSFFTLTSTISPTLRSFVQITNVVILGYLFLKRYGLQMKDYPKIPASIKYFIISVLLIMTISSINSNFVLAGLEHTSRTLLFMLVVYSIYSLIDGERRIKLILISLIFCSVIYFMFFIFKLFELNFNLVELYGYLFSEEGAEYLGKNYLGVFFSIVIIILTSLSFSNEFKNRRGFIYFIIAVLFCSLIVTNSRASIFCLLISVSAILYMLNRKLFYLGFLFLAALSIIIFLTPFGSDILLYLRVEDLGTGREYLINSAIEVIKENYLFGVGPGGTKYELYSSMPYMANTHQEWMILKNIRDGEIGQAHNFYLFYFSDLGIFGFILSLIFPIIFFNLTYKLMRKLKLKSSSKYFLVVGIYSTGIFMFIRGIFEPQNLLSFGGISADLPFWLLISIISYYYSKHFTKLKPGAIQE